MVVVVVVVVHIIVCNGIWQCRGANEAGNRVEETQREDQKLYLTLICFRFPKTILFSLTSYWRFHFWVVLVWFWFVFSGVLSFSWLFYFWFFLWEIWLFWLLKPWTFDESLGFSGFVSTNFLLGFMDVGFSG